MKTLATLALAVLLTGALSPLSADAFGRRPNSSEVFQNRPPSQTQPGQPGGYDRPRQSVPEPSSGILLGLGLGLGLGLIVLVSTNRLRSDK